MFTKPVSFFQQEAKIIFIIAPCILIQMFYYVEIKCQLDATDDFYCPQTGHTTLSSTPYRQLENQASNTAGSSHLYNTLELLMMGIMVPETC